MAGLPVILLLGCLVAGMAAHRAALTGLVAALLIAIFGFGMPTASALAAAGQGAAFGLLPIGWIVVNAVFLYHLTVRAGQFEVLKLSIANLTPDRRLQALMIAFCFGSFIEGAAGFGTPVAISAALLIGLGFRPLQAASLALVANTSPVAFGALGTPIITLAKVSGIDEMALSQMAGRQLPLFSLLIPAWLVGMLAGWRGIVGCWPAIFVCGGSFATLQFLLSNFHGPALVDVVAGIGSLFAMVLLLQVWQPKTRWRFPEEDASNLVESKTIGQTSLASPSPVGPATLTRKQTAYAWGPWLILSLLVLAWGWPSVKIMLNGGTQEKANPLAGLSKIDFPVPYLHRVVYPSAPVAVTLPGETRGEKPFDAIYECNWLSATGTSIFLACILSALWMRISFAEFIQQGWSTLYQMRWALLTITCMLALAFTTKYCGSDATLGLAFTKTGWLYPFFAPMLGWLGVALTGSDTSSNALFGNLQRITAERLGLNPTLIVASNSTGGVMGKMIDAQSIVVAAVATQQTGGEGKILMSVFWHSLLLATCVGLVTITQAYWLTFMIPQ